MTSLQALQQQMLQAVLAENPPALSIIRDNGIADARSRLAVYQHGYRVRLRDALQAEFTGLRSMAGRRFGAMLDKYIAAHPSEHYNIRWYGAGLAAFLGYAHPWRDQPQFADMARLDWAISVAFDAADETHANVADLSTVPPDAWPALRLSLQQNLHVLDCRCNADAFRRAADHARPRPRLRHFEQARQILVWRKDTTVHYRRLDEDEWQVLGAAIRGESFAALCAGLAAHHGETAAMPRMAVMLQGWLAAGLIRGWTFIQT
ncbi:MAG TPA: DNA-binding domain-containing protein [Dyella sp.]|uniref:DNA-binding domain-containing protein n=1 Tax=Dyella sp. TaxID=1869338 RepID=UPI002CA48D35|nr:DNA-binding domain-containing protein [Dyella sp.]HUB92256.1 DNA-binding domain-containing protein [Dyella sp.]